MGLGYFLFPHMTDVQLFSHKHGHIHTAISVLQGRVEEIKKELEGKMNE